MTHTKIAVSNSPVPTHLSLGGAFIYIVFSNSWERVSQTTNIFGFRLKKPPAIPLNELSLLLGRPGWIGLRSGEPGSERAKQQHVADAGCFRIGYAYYLY